MPIEHINDLDDPRVAIYRSLKSQNETRHLDQFVVEGLRLVERLAASRFPVVSVLITDRYLAGLELILPASIPIFVVPHELIHDLVGFPFHRGVLAAGARVPWPAIQELFAARPDRTTIVICPKLTNPENLGTIARIGDVLGVNAILAGPSCPDPFSRRVIRVSMGAVLRLPVLIEPELDAVTDRLVDEFDLDLQAAVADPLAPAYDAIPRPNHVGLILGEEHSGLDPEWLSRCRPITIPMREGASSLNVAVAAGILIHHLTRP